MHIDVISGHHRLDAVKADWDFVYAADPEATHFLSWTWLKGWFQSLDGNWLVLAAKADADSDTYVGFLPLRKRTRRGENGNIHVEVSIGGTRASDYTGFICLPEVQRQVTVAFAKALADMPWTVLHLDCLLMSDERADLFLARYTPAKFQRIAPLIDAGDDVDLSICPFVRLPASWDEYLAEKMGSNTRQKARRFLRKLDSGDDALRVTHTTADTFELDFEILMGFWMAKWSARKGDRTQPIVRAFAAMLRRSLATDTLFMPVLWRGDTALGALAFLVDTIKKSLLFKVSGLDTTGNNPPPGFLLHAYSIRRAIADGFQTYDLLSGNDPYKYAFGAEERRIRSVRFRRRTPRLVRPELRPQTDRFVQPPLAQLPFAPSAPRTLSGLPLSPPRPPFDLERSKGLS